MANQYDNFAYLAALTFFCEEANSRGYKMPDEDSDRLVEYADQQEELANKIDDFIVGCLKHLSTKMFVPISLITFMENNNV